MHSLVIAPQLASQVLTIARVAGKAIMRVYQDLRSDHLECNDVLVTYKADDSPVTKADLLAHQLIAQQLAALTPHVPVVSEEDPQSLQYRLPNGDFWLVDPLDGTKEFLAQNDEFTVNIALIRNSQAVLGVVLVPALDQAYWGAMGLGAWRITKDGQESIHTVSPTKSHHPIRVMASKSHNNAETIAFIRKLGAHELRQAGSSLKFCRVAEGVADIYPRLGPTCEWDTAAAQAVVEAAGGHVLTLDGTPLRYGKPTVLNPYFVVTGGSPSAWLGT